MSGTPVNYIRRNISFGDRLDGFFFYSAISTTHFFIWIKPSFCIPFRIFFTPFLGNSSSIFLIVSCSFFVVSCFIVRQRTCLSEPSNFDCWLNGFILVFLAVSSNAHWSMSALCRSRDFPLGIIFSANASSALVVILSGNLNKKINTLLIFVSITGTGIFQANAIMAAEVYGPIHGSFCNWVLSSVISIFQFWILNFKFWIWKPPLAIFDQPLVNFDQFWSIICFAHCCNLNALLLNPSPDRCLRRSDFDAWAKLA